VQEIENRLSKRECTEPGYLAGAMLRALGLEPDTETPVRLVKALRELTEGYATEDLGALLKAFDAPADPGVVMVRGIEFASLCEHHVLPFTGTVAVAYIPRERVVGLSKIPRLVRAVTRRLQLQERIGQMVADTMMQRLDPVGVMVIVRARHTCMGLRGVESQGEMVTSCVRGVFSSDPAARAEAMALISTA
jgi:GTP cyclohydrolase I